MVVVLAAAIRAVLVKEMLVPLASSFSMSTPIGEPSGGQIGIRAFDVEPARPSETTVPLAICPSPQLMTAV